MTWIFAAPQGDEVALLENAETLLSGRPPGFLSGEELVTFTKTHGSDLATAMALHAIRTAPDNRGYLNRLGAIPLQSTALSATALPLVIVPTMYHRERPELGGDGALIRSIATRLGVRCGTIPTPSLGDISGNALVIIDHLERMSGPAWFISISKGTADLKRALILRPDLINRMAGWISLAGMPGGSLLAIRRPGQPIAHAMIEGWLRLRGARPSMLKEMSPDHSFSLDRLVLPGQLPVINLVPMPMSFHLRKPVDRSARYLAQTGPNDGYVLLAHALLPGRVVPLFAADHYLRVPELTPLLYRLLRLHLGCES